MMSLLNKRWFSRIRRPSRYLGNEINSLPKSPDDVEVSIALAFPDVYEVGMSHLGLKILYHILNDRSWLSAERVFCPWTDLEKELRDRRIPLPSLESGRSLSQFHIIGFSLQHELSFTNVLTMLDLAGIPFLSKDRDDKMPLIIAGGPACFNPEPVADLFDAMVIGDGEEVTLDICRAVRGASGRGRAVLLGEMSKLKGVYIPSFFNVHYGPDETIHEIKSRGVGHDHVTKAVLTDMEKYPFPAAQIVPYTELIHDRLVVEICRGCTRGCRFCQAGMIYRPVRERDPKAVLKNVEYGLVQTGFEEISLLSLSSGDYSCIGPLLKTLMDHQAGVKTAVSLPSLRIDSLEPAWFDQIKRVRKTGFTLAPEAGNDRMRRIINKTLTNEEILNMAREVYHAGWNLIKLYFMIGLPGEEEQDVRDIITLSRKVIGLGKKIGKRVHLNVSVSTFVPKAHTPFMWAPQIAPEESEKRMRWIQDGLRDKRIRVKWNAPGMSWLEGIFSRGDRRLSRALVKAWQKGARFDAWSEHFQKQRWEEAFQETGLSPSLYLYRKRTMDEILPWDHIQSGVKKEHFKKEWEKAQAGLITPDCRSSCFECGVCDHELIDPVLVSDGNMVQHDQRTSSTLPTGHVVKYLFTFSKTGNARYLSHLELVRLMIRAFKRTQLPLRYSEGFHPMPRISFTTALPTGTESINETFVVEFIGDISPAEAKDRINRQLPPGISITFVENVTGRKKSFRLKESHYHVTLEHPHVEPDDLEKFLCADHFPVIKKTKKGDRVIDAKPQVKTLAWIRPDTLGLVLLHGEGPELKPIDIVKGIFRLDRETDNGIKILKIKQVIS